MACFFVMVALAQGLPIRHVPEQRFIAPVWQDVVNDRSGRVLALRKAGNAKGMFP